MSNAQSDCRSSWTSRSRGHYRHLQDSTQVEKDKARRLKRYSVQVSNQFGIQAMKYLVLGEINRHHLSTFAMTFTTYLSLGSMFGQCQARAMAKRRLDHQSVKKALQRTSLEVFSKSLGSETKTKRQVRSGKVDRPSKSWHGPRAESRSSWVLGEGRISWLSSSQAERMVK